MSCVLLRQLIVSQGDKLAQEQPDALEPCKIQLLQVLQTETEPIVRRKVCDAVAELARLFIDEAEINHWPEVLQFLYQSSTSQVTTTTTTTKFPKHLIQSIFLIRFKINDIIPFTLVVTLSVDHNLEPLYVQFLRNHSCAIRAT